MWKSVGLLVAATATVVAVSGCEQFLTSTFEDDTTERVQISEIRVEGGSGDVVVRPGAAASTVDIHRIVRYRGDQAPDESTYRIDGTTLRLRTECDTRRCEVSYAIRAPEGVRISGQNGSGSLRVDGVSTVDFRVSSGDIAVRGATGTVNVRTGSGNISLVDVRGGVTARTSSGDIEGIDLQAESVNTETGSGNVRLELARAVSVRAKTGTGDVRLAVPTGDFRVQADTGAGDTEIRVPSNPNGTLLLDLSTGSGDIVVNPR